MRTREGPEHAARIDGIIRKRMAEEQIPSFDRLAEEAEINPRTLFNRRQTGGWDIGEFMRVMDALGASDDEVLKALGRKPAARKLEVRLTEEEAGRMAMQIAAALRAG